MPFGVCACAWGQFRRTMAAPFGVPGCSTLIPFRVQFFGVRGLPPIFAPQPTTPVTFIFLLSRFALLHICIHIYICVKMYVCTYTTKCKCVHTYLYLHICVYFCIIYIYIGVNKSEVEIYVCIYGRLSKLGSLIYTYVYIFV